MLAQRLALGLALTVAACNHSHAPSPTPMPDGRQSGPVHRSVFTMPQSGTLTNCRQIATSSGLQCSNINLRILRGRGTYVFPGKHKTAPFVALSWQPQSNAADTYVFQSLSAKQMTVRAVRTDGQFLPSHTGVVSLTIVYAPGS